MNKCDKIIRVFSLFALAYFLASRFAYAQERDPFVSIIDIQSKKFSLQKVNLGNVSLKGVILSKERAVAIINDELVSVGDEWRGLKVEAIDKNSVTLKDGIKSYKFFLENEEKGAGGEENAQEQAIPEPTFSDIENLLPPGVTMPDIEDKKNEE